MFADNFRDFAFELFALVNELVDSVEVNLGLYKSLKLSHPTLDVLGLGTTKTFQMFIDFALHFGIGDVNLAVATIPVVVEVVRKDHEEPGLCAVIVHCMEKR